MSACKNKGEGATRRHKLKKPNLLHVSFDFGCNNLTPTLIPNKSEETPRNMKDIPRWLLYIFNIHTEIGFASCFDMVASTILQKSKPFPRAPPSHNSPLMHSSPLEGIQFFPDPLESLGNVSISIIYLARSYANIREIFFQALATLREDAKAPLSKLSHVFDNLTTSFPFRSVSLFWQHQDGGEAQRSSYQRSSYRRASS